MATGLTVDGRVGPQKRKRRTPYPSPAAPYGMRRDAAQRQDGGSTGARGGGRSFESTGVVYEGVRLSPPGR